MSHESSTLILHRCRPLLEHMDRSALCSPLDSTVEEDTTSDREAENAHTHENLEI